MAVPRLFRQNNGSAVVFLGIGVVPLLIALGLILAAPHSALAAPCDPQVSGYGPTTSPDTVDALHANFVYGATASNAPIPAGYSVFDNNGNVPFGVYGTWSAAHSKPTKFSRPWATIGPKAGVLDTRGPPSLRPLLIVTQLTPDDIKVPNVNYLGWRNLQSYDPPNCSSLCNSTSTCRSFNMFFQRSPTLEPSWNPSSPCYNPNSTVEIMCTLWNTNITASAIETNFGWPRGGFNVSIVASKYYNKKGS